MHQPELGWRMRMYGDFVRCKVRRTQSSVMCMGNGNGNHKHMRAEMSAIDINEERDGERGQLDYGQLGTVRSCIVIGLCCIDVVCDGMYLCDGWRRTTT